MVRPLGHLIWRYLLLHLTTTATGSLRRVTDSMLNVFAMMEMCANSLFCRCPTFRVRAPLLFPEVRQKSIDS